MAVKDIKKLFLLTPFVQAMADMSRNQVEQVKKVIVDHVIKQSAFGSNLADGITRDLNIKIRAYTN